MRKENFKEIGGQVLSSATSTSSPQLGVMFSLRFLAGPVWWRSIMVNICVRDKIHIRHTTPLGWIHSSKWIHWNQRSKSSWEKSYTEGQLCCYILVSTCCMVKHLSGHVSVSLSWGAGQQNTHAHEMNRILSNGTEIIQTELSPIDFTGYTLPTCLLKTLGQHLNADRMTITSEIKVLKIGFYSSEKNVLRLFFFLPLPHFFREIINHVSQPHSLTKCKVRFAIVTWCMHVLFAWLSWGRFDPKQQFVIL